MKVLSIEEQGDGSAIMKMDVDILEYTTFVSIGHKANPEEFDDAKCFEFGVVDAIKAKIEYETQQREK